MEVSSLSHMGTCIFYGMSLELSRSQIERSQMKFPIPGKQGWSTYLPSRGEDGGRRVSGLGELDVELGRRAYTVQRCEDWR